jgi:hypothetical protein
MAAALFRIRPQGDSWTVVEETYGRELGGVFYTLAAALQFVARESRRFPVSRTVIEQTS